MAACRIVWVYAAESAPDYVCESWVITRNARCNPKERRCTELNNSISLTLNKYFLCSFELITFHLHLKTLLFLFARQPPPQWARAYPFTRCLDHTQRRTTVGRTPLEEGSARRRDLYLHNTQHTRQTDIHAPPVGFEPTISAGERPQTYALDRGATGTGWK